MPLSSLTPEEKIALFLKLKKHESWCTSRKNWETLAENYLKTHKDKPIN